MALIFPKGQEGRRFVPVSARVMSIFVVIANVISIVNQTYFYLHFILFNLHFIFFDRFLTLCLCCHACIQSTLFCMQIIIRLHYMLCCLWLVLLFVSHSCYFNWFQTNFGVEILQNVLDLILLRSEIPWATDPVNTNYTLTTVLISDSIYISLTSLCCVLCCCKFFEVPDLFA